MEIYKEEKRKVYTYIYEEKEVNEQIERKMNQDVDRNSNLFWKEVSKVKSCSRIKDANERLALGEG